MVLGSTEFFICSRTVANKLTLMPSPEFSLFAQGAQPPKFVQGGGGVYRGVPVKWVEKTGKVIDGIYVTLRILRFAI